MMDKKLHIIPYTKEHGQFILSCQMNHKVLEADRQFINVEGNAKNLEQNNLAFTGMINKTYLCCRNENGLGSSS